MACDVATIRRAADVSAIWQPLCQDCPLHGRCWLYTAIPSHKIRTSSRHLGFSGNPYILEGARGGLILSNIRGKGLRCSSQQLGPVYMSITALFVTWVPDLPKSLLYLFIKSRQSTSLLVSPLDDVDNLWYTPKNTTPLKQWKHPKELGFGEDQIWDCIMVKCWYVLPIKYFFIDFWHHDWW